MKINLRIPLLDHLQLSDTTILLGTAVTVGAGTGLSAVGFIKLISLIQTLFFVDGATWLSFIGRGLFFVAPAIGGLLAGPIIAYLAPEAKGHGVPEVMQAIALKGGRIRPIVSVAKMAASALCIGSGGSAGREGPIVQVGAALGSTIGQWLKTSEERLRNLVACGAAAGIAATFNAPIAGVLFAIEIILGEFQIAGLGNIVVSAVTASLVARFFLGEQPAFNIPHYNIKTPWEVFLFVLLGVFAALAAVFFIRLLYWSEDKFDDWKISSALKPAIGGTLLGALAFFYPMILGLGFIPESENLLHMQGITAIPHIFGSGFPFIESALLGKLSLGLLLVLVFLKPLATSLTLGSGNSGGVFAPALFIGAVLGGAFGHLVEMLFPGMTAGVGAFAIVGMAAVFAGAARAPFTAILIVFEMTNDYSLILPLMAGVVVAMLVADRLYPESIYTLKLVRRGIHLRRGRDVDVMESVRVSDVMVRDLITMNMGTPVTILAEKFIETGRHGFAVLDRNGDLYGIVSLADYRDAMDKNPTLESLTVGDIASRAVTTVYPDETVGVAMRRMAPRDLSRLPVVERDNPRHLVGMVRRNDIVRAYEVGITNREEARLRTGSRYIRDISGFATTQIRVEAGSACAGHRMSEIHWPQECIIAAIRRRGQSIIPHGDSKLQAGDIIVAVTEGLSLQVVLDLCSSPSGEKKPPGTA